MFCSFFWQQQTKNLRTSKRTCKKKVFNQIWKFVRNVKFTKNGHASILLSTSSFTLCPVKCSVKGHIFLHPVKVDTTKIVHFLSTRPGKMWNATKRGLELFLFSCVINCDQVMIHKMIFQTQWFDIKLNGPYNYCNVFLVVKHESTYASLQDEKFFSST